MLVRIEKTSGEGRPFVCLDEEAMERPQLRTMVATISKEAAVTVCSCVRITKDNWPAITDALVETLNKAGIRHPSLIGSGAACSVILNAVITGQVAARTVILIDPPAIPHPTFWDRLVDRIEAMLPLGLPLRTGSGRFDARPFLHRVRCPVLLLQSGSSETSMATLQQGISLGMAEQLHGNEEQRQEQIKSVLARFLAVPARCSQKMKHAGL